MAESINMKSTKQPAIKDDDLLVTFIAMCMENNASFLSRIQVLYNNLTGEDKSYDSIKTRLRKMNLRARELLEKPGVKKDDAIEDKAAEPVKTPRKRKTTSEGDGDKIEKRGRGRPKKAKADCGIPAEGIEAGEDSPVDLDTAV